MNPCSKPRRSGGIVLSMAIVSFALHGTLYAAIDRAPRPAAEKQRVAEFEIVRPPPPPKVEPPAPPPAPQAEPPPPPKAIKIARAPAPRPALPPPPNTEPPPEIKPAPIDAPPPVIRIGISLGSTTSAGGFAVGVGNTLYGKADGKAADPAEVKPYQAPAVQLEPRPASFVAPTRVSTLPRVLAQPKPAYTPEARKEGIEGQVVLLLGIDASGHVVSVKRLTGLGYGLDEAAERAARELRFAPATLDGAAVSTEIRFTYIFLLE